MSKKLMIFAIITSLLLVGFVAGLDPIDIAVINVTTSTDIIYAGWNVIINATVLNNGTSIESFNVSVYYDNTFIGLQNVTDLSPSNDTTLSFEWNTALVPLYTNYTISANATIILGESNIDNNLLTYGPVKIVVPGDINGDGTIDLMDLFNWSYAFGSSLGHPRWNPLADVSQDGMVEMLDVLLMAQHLGESYP